jgi:hypothetical protein
MVSSQKIAHEGWHNLYRFFNTKFHFMNRVILACIIIFPLLSCGGGKHEAEIKDSRLIQPQDSNTGREIIDSVNIKGSKAKTDTADSANRARGND